MTSSRGTLGRKICCKGSITTFPSIVILSSGLQLTLALLSSSSFASSRREILLLPPAVLACLYNTMVTPLPLALWAMSVPVAAISSAYPRSQSFCSQSCIQYAHLCQQSRSHSPVRIHQASDTNNCRKKVGRGERVLWPRPHPGAVLTIDHAC